MLAILTSVSSHPYATTAVSLLTLYYLIQRLSSSPSRTLIIPANEERVLILGATSGIGREIALRYARRRARVCVVGRRAELLNEVSRDCMQLQTDYTKVLGLVGDFTVVEDMVHVRDALQSKWGGIDTVIVNAGVSALRPLLDVTDEYEHISGPPKERRMPSAAGIEQALKTSQAAITGNYSGPLIAAVTFIPLLEQTSRAPALLQVSSLASVIPAPTRTLYGSTKAASFLLYKALGIEHPSVRVSCVLPSTVEGDFRASAVDGGPVREADPGKTGLLKGDVAERCILAVDQRERTVFIPWKMKLAMGLWWLWPAFVDSKAAKKYQFVSTGQ
ncbi:hypothetical protein BDV98DRAFT_559259 [Pterulicium gracile]|uniref:NAD(P)-binding protein n=1 Tax=Pterulicium gracile TaxID=1884261 RepID=A0A5C3R189_9AGAR|nr:hypothetical protein BDV98DRAFT_559259 [Pterula gracilis]